MHNDFFLTQWVFLGMRWLFETVTGQSIALTVIISTILIKAITVIGDITSRKSSAKMQTIQPQMDKLRKKYENDPQRLQRESSKLMKENNVSMLGGCLPMLFTMPLFFVFIAAFRQWGNEMMVHVIATLQADQEAGVELFRNFQFLWVHNIWQPDNGLSAVVQSGASFLATPDLHKLLYLQNNPEIWEKLMDMGIAARAYFVDNDGVMQATYRFLTSESAIAAYDQAVQPFIDLYAGYNNGWFILPVLSGVSQFLASWLMQKNQPKTDNPAASSGKMMLYIFPIMSFVFCLSYNAAFAIYWTLSSMLMLLMNLYMNKKYPIAPVVKEEKKE